MTTSVANQNSKNVIIVGNGLNRAMDKPDNNSEISVSWDKLLYILAKIFRVTPPSATSNLPFTLEFERLIYEFIKDKSLEDVKSFINSLPSDDYYKKMASNPNCGSLLPPYKKKDPETGEKLPIDKLAAFTAFKMVAALIYDKQAEIIRNSDNCEHLLARHKRLMMLSDSYYILTPNFDPLLELSILSREEQRPFRLNLTKYSDMSVESLLFINRADFESKPEAFQFHGNLYYSNEIVLGLEHYVSYSSAIKRMFDDKTRNDDNDRIFWPQLILDNDVDIIGWALDPSELDFWAILDFRFQQAQSNDEIEFKNIIRFYSNDIDPSKEAFLKACGVTVIKDTDLFVSHKNIGKNYPLFYDKVIDFIENNHQPLDE